MHGTGCAHQIVGRIYQREVRKGLRKVSQLPTFYWIVFFCEKPDVIAQTEKVFE